MFHRDFSRDVDARADAPFLTFIIPVRHPHNAKDWGQLTAKLAQTLESVAGQTHPDWRGLVVANEGADLPPMPDGFSVVRVTFPPNRLHDMGTASEEAILDAFRFDKGRRVLAGMLAARDSRYFMIIDDDDLISNRIVGYVRARPEGGGWYVAKGYLWNDAGAVFCGVDNFNDLCGSSLIVRGDLYGIPDRFEDADAEWIKDMLGSHRRIRSILAANGATLGPLPFRAAVYRVGSSGSHSRTPGIGRLLFFHRGNLSRPDRFLRSLLKLRRIGGTLSREFFGRPVDQSGQTSATSPR